MDNKPTKEQITKADHAMILGLEELIRSMNLLIHHTEKINKNVNLLVTWFIIIPIILFVIMFTFGFGIGLLSS
jgi:hypothetical protein